MKKKRWIVTLIVIGFLALWFSDVLPKQVVKLVASNYMSKQENGHNYKLKMVEYSPAHDAYFAYFNNATIPDQDARNIGVYYRWFPFHVYFDSYYPG